MLSERLERLAEWADTWVTDVETKRLLIAHLNVLAADASALEASIVPAHARRDPLAEGGNVASLALARRRRCNAEDEHTS
jgi:hypothetical protein